MSDITDYPNPGEHPEGYVDLTAGTAGDGSDVGYGAPSQDPIDASGAGVSAASPAGAPVPTQASAQTDAPASEPAPAQADVTAPQSPSATLPATMPSPTIPSPADPRPDDSKAGDDSRVLKSPFPLPDLRDDADEDDVDQSREEFTTVYDIIDRLEASINEAKGSIFTPGMVRIDRDVFEDDLNELKKMLPVQLERASALMREAERRLEGAQTQANAIVASAQSQAADIVKEANEQAQFLAGQENVTELARQKARTILNTAQAKADHLTHGADEYSTKVMETLRAQLTKMGNDVDAGLNVLYERRQSAARDLPHLEDDDYPESR